MGSVSVAIAENFYLFSRLSLPYFYTNSFELIPLRFNLLHLTNWFIVNSYLKPLNLLHHCYTSKIEKGNFSLLIGFTSVLPSHT